jgi:hypothetical protein
MTLIRVPVTCRPTPRRRVSAAGGALAFLIALQAAPAMSQQFGPTVRPPVAPQVQEGAMEATGAKVKTWQPGDPVRVVPDLRQDGGPAVPEQQRAAGQAPVVHVPVAPQVLDEDLRALQKAEPHREGEPVRVVPDLRQDPAGN